MSKKHPKNKEKVKPKPANRTYSMVGLQFTLILADD